ncbi:hypothetical protein FVE85_2311 [Porphyridium purpureum]|uniref:Uncharacterized protein n=1 Tax=Porphyridium purpureum TaxID=35688 RepID=A0A5J4YXS6_PORPP|nr:hypothetical protein FVE85_2311 [Porphyridium purpureum]|eukprot:POR8275..scf209_3
MGMRAAPRCQIYSKQTGEDSTDRGGKQTMTKDVGTPWMTFKIKRPQENEEVDYLLQKKSVGTERRT